MISCLAAQLGIDESDLCGDTEYIESLVPLESRLMANRKILIESEIDAVRECSPIAA